MPKRQACTGRRAALYHLYSEYQEVVSHALKNEFSKEVEILWDPNSIGEASSPQDGLQPADIPDPEPELPPYKHVASDNSEAAIKANITLNAKLVVWLLDHQPSLLTKELRCVIVI